MDTLIKDRKTLHKKAQQVRRKGQSAEQFESFVRRIYPGKILSIGNDNFRHLISLVWG